ncbi:MAG: divalent-cation tolerance protein CutA [Candidatus Zixiibacteriota bacterium]|nr:MAG: divalent-cation tolerance protein CutA [candidate division Zixibacteria bacterium]
MIEKIRIVFISLPRDEVKRIARGLVENRLAACVNIIPRIESYYRWDDRVEHDEEALLFVKTTSDKFEDLRTWVIDNHPYDLPEIIAVPLSEGNSDYIAWIKMEMEAP